MRHDDTSARPTWGRRQATRGSGPARADAGQGAASGDVLTAGRRWCLALVGIATALLVACGPGVGGTGTGTSATAGQTGLAYFGAFAQPVCGGALSGAIGCTPGAAGSTPTPPSLRQFTSECAVATVEGDEVTLDLLCEGTVAYFQGRWGVGPDLIGRYYGLVGTDALLPPTDPAYLEVQVDGAAVTVWLRGSAGQLLAGPLLLR
jgi:hypothetical protein